MPRFGFGLCVPVMGGDTSNLGPELAIDGAFNNASNWVLGTSVAISAGVLSYNASAGAQNASQATTALVAGRSYRVSCEAAPGAVGQFLLQIVGLTVAASSVFSGPGLVSAVLVAPDTPATLRIRFLADFSGSIDNYSCREVLA